MLGRAARPNRQRGAERTQRCVRARAGSVKDRPHLSLAQAKMWQLQHRLPAAESWLSAAESRVAAGRERAGPHFMCWWNCFGGFAPQCALERSQAAAAQELERSCAAQACFTGSVDHRQEHLPRAVDGTCACTGSPGQDRSVPEKSRRSCCTAQHALSQLPPYLAGAAGSKPLCLRAGPGCALDQVLAALLPQSTYSHA